MSFPIVVADQFANMVHLAMHQRRDAELGEPILLLRDALRALDTSGVDLAADPVPGDDGAALRASLVGVEHIIPRSRPSAATRAR